MSGKSSAADRAVDRLEPTTTYAGLYWTCQTTGGLHVDSVVQHSWYGGHALPSNGNRIGIDGTGILARSRAAGAGDRAGHVAVRCDDPDRGLVGHSTDASIGLEIAM